MRYPASEKLEIIGIVEGSHQPIKRTLEQIGVSRPTFYRWYDLYRRLGLRVWKIGARRSLRAEGSNADFRFFNVFSPIS